MFFIVQGNWVWAETGEDADYTNWGPRQPIGGPDEDCAFKSYIDGYIGWCDYRCDVSEWIYPIHAICEAKSEEPGAQL